MTTSTLERPRVEAAPVPSRRRPGALLAPLVPVVVLLVLGAVQLSRHLGLWYDEDYTLLAVRTPLPTLLRSVATTSPLVSWLTVAPSFNAPYYVVMHGWCAVFGTSTTAIRVPSLLCAAAAVGVLARAVQLTAGARAGLVAGLLVATGPLFAQQAVEARSYGMAELATALCVLALVRRLQGTGRLWPLGAAAAAAGLLHWFTLPVLLALAVAALLLRRRGLPEAVTLVLGTLPALALVAVQVTGTGDGTPIAVQPGLELPVQAVSDWSLGAWWLSVALTAAFVVGLVRSRHRVLLACWVLLPLVCVTAIGLLRPLYFDRYLLFTLMGLAAGAAVGVCSLPGRWRTLVPVALVAVSLVACVPRLQSEAREHQDRAVALLTAQQVAGEPVAAGDGRAALELVEEVTQQDSRLAADLVLRPAHVPVDGTATVVWLVRSGSGAAAEPSPNDAYLAAGGWHLDRTTVVSGTYGDLTLERWVR